VTNKPCFRATVQLPDLIRGRTINTRIFPGTRGGSVPGGPYGTLIDVRKVGFGNVGFTTCSRETRLAIRAECHSPSAIAAGWGASCHLWCAAPLVAAAGAAKTSLYAAGHAVCTIKAERVAAGAARISHPLTSPGKNHTGPRRLTDVTHRTQSRALLPHG